MAVKSFVLPLHLTNQSFSPIEIGLVVGIGSTISMFFAPWAGVVVDRISKRLLLAVSGMGIGVSLALFAIVGSLVPALAVATILAISTLFLRIALVVGVVEVNTQRRTSMIGLLNGVNALGSGLGSVLAGWTADRHGYATAFSMGALPIIFVSAVVPLVGVRKLVKTSSPEKSHSHRPIRHIVQQVLKRITLPMLFLACDMGITVAWRTFLPLYLVNFLGWSITSTGGLIAAQNIIYSACQPLLSYLTDRLGHKRSLVIGLSCYGMLISLIPLVNSTWAIYSLVLLSAVFASPIYPTSLALAADITSEDERGTAMGFMMASSNLAGALGPLVAGLIVSIVAAPYAGFAYSVIPALLVCLISYFFFDTNISNKSSGDSKNETF